MGSVGKMVATDSVLATQQVLAVIFLGSGILAAVVAARAARFRQQAAWRYLAHTMVAVALWCFSDAMFFVLAQDDGARWFWLVIGYVASIATAPLIFSVALCFAGHERRLTPPVLALLWTPFVLGMVLAVTNRWHGLIWDATLSPLEFTSGPGHGFYFFLLLPLAYGLPLIAAAIFLHSCWRLRHIYRQQALVLSIAVLLPVVASVLYFTDLNPFPGVDLAPAAFAATGVLGLYGMAQLRFMELRPIYRDALFEQMLDGALVVDDTGTLLDLNPAAQHLLAVDERCVGGDVRPYLAARFALDELDLAEGSYQMLATHETPPRYFDVRVTGAGAQAARLVVLRDTTRMHEAIVAVYEQGIILAERQRAEAVFTADIQRAVGQLKAQIRQAMEQLDRGRLGLATATLAEADSVTAATLLAEVDAVQGQAGQPEDFPGAVEHYVRNFAAAAGLEVTFAVDATLRTDLLAPGTRLHLVRILQEALENVAHHSAAGRIEVSLAHTAQGLALTVRDDGAGFDPAKAATCATAPGLEAMQRRALAARGALSVDAAPGGGTCVRLDLPIAPRAAVLHGLKVVVAHGHPIVLDGLRALLAEQGIAPAAICHDRAALAQALDGAQPDLVLLDIDLPGGTPTDILQQARRSRPKARLVVLLESERDPRLPALFHHGADGYLVNSQGTAAFLDALAQIVEGAFPLQAGVAAQVLLEFRRQETTEPPVAMTARQQEILRLVGAGLTYEEIATRLYLSERTVRYHTEQLRRQLKLANRSELAEYARRHAPASGA